MTCIRSRGMLPTTFNLFSVRERYDGQEMMQRSVAEETGTSLWSFLHNENLGNEARRRDEQRIALEHSGYSDTDGTRPKKKKNRLLAQTKLLASSALLPSDAT